MERREAVRARSVVHSRFVLRRWSRGRLEARKAVENEEKKNVTEVTVPYYCGTRRRARG